MCRFKSGIILKNRVVLAPIYNDSHSRLLESIGIEDTEYNAKTKFVRAELVPVDDDVASDPKKWIYVVDQDVVPDWYKRDPERYELEFREAVEDWVSSNIKIMCGRAWTKFRENELGEYYMLFGSIGVSEFGSNNNYAVSKVREYIGNNDLVKEMAREYGDRLVPLSINLTSLDGLDDYGTVDGDLFALPTLDLYRECRKNIPKIDTCFWLATPDSTPSGCSSGFVRCVYSNGNVIYGGYYCSGAVRPFCILKS